jgi:hypothetical protein
VGKENAISKHLVVLHKYRCPPSEELNEQKLRAFLLSLLFLSTFLGSHLSTPVVAQPVSSDLLQQKMQLACSFLKSLYNPSLQLVRSTPFSNVYYIASDNLLAEKALLSCDRTISQAINQSMSSCCNRGYDGMHEALLGVRISLPIHTSTTVTVANSSQGKLFRNISPTTAGGNYAVLWEVHNGTGVFPDCAYADVAVYTALELKLEGNTTGMHHEMDCLTLMFDGKGLADEAYKDGSGSEHGIYQTYKLALYLYALQATGAYHYGKEDHLLQSQGPDGGFHTGYDQLGTYAGTQENAETTSIVIVTITSLSTARQFVFPFFRIPPWTIYLFTGLAVAASAVVVTIFIWDQRKRKQTRPMLLNR